MRTAIPGSLRYTVLPVHKASAPAHAPYLHPCRQKKPTINGRLERVLRYEE